MWQKIIAFCLIYIDNTRCISEDNQIFRSLVTPTNASVPECKQLQFKNIIKKHGVTDCAVKGETFKFGDQLGQGSFGVVYDATNLQGVKRAIKFVRNQNDTIALEEVEQENSVMKKFRENNIPNVATIEEPTEIDEKANLFIITMQKYYKDVLKFINEDVPGFGWNSVDMLKFVAKIAVKYEYFRC